MTDKKDTWFSTHQIETFVGDIEKSGSRKKLIVLHQCKEDKEALISQLETMIHGLKTDFDNFGS